MSTPVQTRGKHAERSQATRQHLIDTAIRVIQDRGYEAASLHEVAKAAGMTTGAVQHHFESRAVLMMQVLAGLIQADDHVGGNGGSRGARAGLQVPRTANSCLPSHRLAGRRAFLDPGTRGGRSGTDESDVG